jgi:DMSO/TMAO reductase YedYZ molybdopterin-dependent catalytic subunit
MLDELARSDYEGVMDERYKRERIVEARMKLKARFEREQASTPSLSDTSPLGTGPLNRHGMPQLPPGQIATDKWPVLDLGQKPVISPTSWRFVVDGACDAPLSLDWQGFMALEQVRDTSDFHCVTTWSKFDIKWVGVRASELIARSLPHDDARYVLCHAFDGYTTNLSLAECLKPDVLLVHTAQGKPLPVDHGGPVRMITPQLYAWKGAKWISRIELLREEQLGFWEERGYSSTAHPWRDDRYS